MCGRFGFILLKDKDGQSRYYRLFEDETTIYKDQQIKQQLKEIEGFRGRADIRPSQKALVIRRNEDGGHIVEEMVWGLKPSWSKTLIINARVESLFFSKFWKKIIPRQRCLIPASYYYEWQEINGKKTPYLIYKKGKENFFFAGLWHSEHNLKTDLIENRFSIITQNGNEKVRTIHNSGPNKYRQPVIIDDEMSDKWLSFDIQEESEILSLIRMYESSEIEVERFKNRTKQY